MSDPKQESTDSPPDGQVIKVELDQPTIDALPPLFQDEAGTWVAVPPEVIAALANQEITQEEYTEIVMMETAAVNFARERGMPIKEARKLAAEAMRRGHIQRTEPNQDDGSRYLPNRHTRRRRAAQNRNR